jgi:hypothetical protein
MSDDFDEFGDILDTVLESALLAHNVAISPITIDENSQDLVTQPTVFIISPTQTNQLIAMQFPSPVNVSQSPPKVSPDRQFFQVLNNAYMELKAGIEFTLMLSSQTLAWQF